MNADQVKELLSNATPGPWALWDSCSWRRFRNAEHKIVAEPYVAHDGHPDLQVTPGTAALIAAAPAVAQWGLERDAEVARLREALERIARWHGEFPHTARYWQNEDGSVSDRPMSYGTVYGSNGERDYMRSIARAALEGTS